jgi:ATP-dependent DNA helicase RecQ
MQSTYDAILNGIQYKKIWGSPNFDAIYQQAGLSRGEVLQTLDYLADQHAITLESKGLTEVYQVNTRVFHQETLLNQLSQYVDEKEVSEIERIATMIRFFQLDRCLNHNLAKYFGDQNAPEHCGHCSVCKGKVLAFTSLTSQQDNWQQDLAFYAREFASHLQSKSPNTVVTDVLITRFLTGLTQPVFTKVKARTLSGFAKYEQQAYRDVLDAVKAQHQAENH